MNKHYLNLTSSPGSLVPVVSSLHLMYPQKYQAHPPPILMDNKHCTTGDSNVNIVLPCKVCNGKWFNVKVTQMGNYILSDRGYKNLSYWQ